MEAKQLPGGLDEWLKTRTIVIGAVNWLKANENRKTLPIPTEIKLVPLLQFELHAQAAVRGQRVNHASADSPTCWGRDSPELIRAIGHTPGRYAGASASASDRRRRSRGNLQSAFTNEVSVIAQSALPG